MGDWRPNKDVSKVNRPQLVKRHRGDEEDTEYGIIFREESGQLVSEKLSRRDFALNPDEL